MPIKNIIFDLGGVLLDIDYQRTIDAFSKLGMRDSSKQFSKEEQALLFRRYEMGQIDSREFISSVSELTGVECSNEEIEVAWCALLGEMTADKYTLLEQLRMKGYRIFILSNTNALHQSAFEAGIDKDYGWEKFEKVFDGVHYSHHLGMRKPNRDIFEKVLDIHGIQAGDTFYIDDTPEHAATASALGMASHHLKRHEKLKEVLGGYSLL